MRFVTLFPQGSNIHLIKDVGQIPYTLKKEFGIEAALISNGVCMYGPNIDDVQGLEIDGIHFKHWGWKIGSFIYLIKNSKKIDWLNLYHYGKKSYFWTRFYKFINPNGKVYLKLDMDLLSCDVLDNSKKAKNTFYKCLNVMDLVSVESSLVLERIQKYTNRKIVLVPNGFKLGGENSNIIEKEDIFLTVGRLGTMQKATEILLEAFALCRKKQNWKLRLIGSLENEFKQYIEDYFLKYPDLKERVKFIGVIKDRKVLAEEYRKAKIFVLPSRWEAFAIVLPEAASQGCKLIVTSAVPACKDFVCEPKFGEIVPPDNPWYLGSIMERMANSYEIQEGIANEIAAYAGKRFSWGNICKEIFRYL